jgi:Rhodopirellula transposase DDE domain
MQDSAAIAGISSRYAALGGRMDEQMRRAWAAAEAKAYGWGGVRAVTAATGVAANTIKHGLKELAAPAAARGARIRKPGGGRKRATQKDGELASALDKLVEPTTRGDPMSPLRWTCKSTTQLSRALKAQSHPASPRTVGRLLRAAGYSLQGNRKTKEGSAHPDRNAQFEHINAEVTRFQSQGQPVISVDTKKKELVGAFKNGGKEWQPKGKPEEVKVHDFMDKTLGKAIPYGIYDITKNEGWVSVGIDHDTAHFSCEAIARWWEKMGKKHYPKARSLLITADGGGSNASRSRLWKTALQSLADRLQITLHVCHFPPGTSKWNKIEHRMFCHITQNWRGKPLISHEVIINLIANTTTKKGLKIQAELDTGTYPTGLKTTKKQLAQVNLKRHEFHGEWNYEIHPNT